MKRVTGFILVVTLWVLAGLAVLAAYIDSVANANLEQAVRIKDSVHSELDRRSTEATLLYLLASNRMGYRSLLLENPQRIVQIYDEEPSLTADTEIGIAGEAYQGLGDWRFSIQDELALISVNKPEAQPFAALLAWAGINRARSAQVIARTLDYVDLDQRLSMGGAERVSYLNRGLVPPANWIMSSAVELKQVLGFEELVSPQQWQALKPFLTMRPPGTYNFNTMPKEVMAAVLGVKEQVVKSILVERQKSPIWELRQIVDLVGVVPNIDQVDLQRLPSGYLRLTLWHPDRGEHLVVGVQLTPFAVDAPWRKDYQYWEQVAEHDSSVLGKPSTALF